MATKKAARKGTKTAVPAKPVRSSKQLPGALDTPDQLRRRLAALVDAWQAAAGTPTPANVERLAKLSAELETGARSVREQAEALAESARISAQSLKRIQAGVPTVEPAVEPGEEVETLESVRGKDRLFEEDDVVPVDFGEIDTGGGPAKPAEPDMPLESFFTHVSDSVVRAQKRLDLASLAYSQELKDSPVPPSLFSIPKVTAEIKLGLSVQKGSNILVTLFGKPENTTNFSESTVSFDVVASAPPPGGTGVYSAPIPTFLVVGLERDKVARAIQDMSTTIKAQTGVDLSGDPAGWLPTAVIARGSALLPEAKRAEYLFLKRGDNPDGTLFTVRFSLAKPQDAKIGKVTGIDLQLALFDLIAKIREWESSVTLASKA